jgi:hypothetical protein
MQVVVLAAVLVVLATTGCSKGSSKTYSSGDVERAFHSQGFDLAGPFYANRTTASGKGPAFWTAKTRKTILVLRFDDQVDAAVVDGVASELQGAGPVPARHVARANVVVVLSGGVTAPVQKRVQAALDGLD